MDQRINYNGSQKIFLKLFEQHKVNTVLKYLWDVKTYLKLYNFKFVNQKRRIAEKSML